MDNITSIKLPKNSIKYILFQRDCYLKNNFIFKFLTLLNVFKPFYKLSISLKTFFFSSKINTEFNKNIEYEYLTIRGHLPQNANSILDIGCGVAGIDVFLSKHYKNNVCIFLIDKTKVDKTIYYGFKNKGSFYNSLQISKSLLEINDVDKNNIYLQETTKNNEIKFNQNFDIVISLISWGFHYPISTYLDEVYRKMNKNGILIVDIRKNTNGEKEIKKRFGDYKTIIESRKFIRVLAKKNK